MPYNCCPRLVFSFYQRIKLQVSVSIVQQLMYSWRIKYCVKWTDSHHHEGVTAVITNMCYRPQCSSELSPRQYLVLVKEFGRHELIKDRRDYGSRCGTHLKDDLGWGSWCAARKMALVSSSMVVPSSAAATSALAGRANCALWLTPPARGTQHCYAYYH